MYQKTKFLFDLFLIFLLFKLSELDLIARSKLGTNSFYFLSVVENLLKN